MLRTARAFTTQPATGEILARVPEGTAAGVERAVAAARSARIGFRDTTPGRRQELLLETADVFERHADKLAALESANVGKPRSPAAEEMPVCVDELRFFTGAARTAHDPTAGEYGEGYPPSCGVSRSASWGRSRRGTTR